MGAAIFGTGFLATFLIVACDATAAVITRDLLAGGEQFFGLLIGLVGLGTVAGSTGLLLRKRSGDPWRDAARGIWLLAAIPASLALAGWVNQAAIARVLAALGCLAGGLGAGVATVQTNTLVQALSPAGWRGRISGGLQAAMVAGQVTGILVTPLLVPALLPLEAYFAVAALALTILGFEVWWLAAGESKRGGAAHG